MLTEEQKQNAVGAINREAATQYEAQVVAINSAIKKSRMHLQGHLEYHAAEIRGLQDSLIKLEPPIPATVEDIFGQDT